MNSFIISNGRIECGDRLIVNTVVFTELQGKQSVTAEINVLSMEYQKPTFQYNGRCLLLDKPQPHHAPYLTVYSAQLNLFHHMSGVQR